MIEQCAIFHLNLKKKWFDMVLSGEKKEEYREIKPYWQKRIRKHSHIHLGTTWWPCNLVRICFSHGYAKGRPQIVVAIKGIRFDSEGKPEWGAVPGEKYFVLELGEILEIRGL